MEPPGVQLGEGLLSGACLIAWRLFRPGRGCGCGHAIAAPVAVAVVPVAAWRLWLRGACGCVVPVAMLCLCLWPWLWPCCACSRDYVMPVAVAVPVGCTFTCSSVSVAEATVGSVWAHSCGFSLPFQNSPHSSIHAEAWRGGRGGTGCPPTRAAAHTDRREGSRVAPCATPSAWAELAMAFQGCDLPAAGSFPAITSVLSLQPWGVSAPGSTLPNHMETL